MEETCYRLQQLLETYIGSLLKDGEKVPMPSFHEVEDLKGMPEQDMGLPVVCTPDCFVTVPE